MGFTTDMQYGFTANHLQFQKAQEVKSDGVLPVLSHAMGCSGKPDLPALSEAILVENCDGWGHIMDQFIVHLCLLLIKA